MLVDEVFGYVVSARDHGDGVDVADSKFNETFAKPVTVVVDDLLCLRFSGEPRKALGLVVASLCGDDLGWDTAFEEPLSLAALQALLVMGLAARYPAIFAAGVNLVPAKAPVAFEATGARRGGTLSLSIEVSLSDSPSCHLSFGKFGHLTLLLWGDLVDSNGITNGVELPSSRNKGLIAEKR